ncbi:MAG: hypothetical protein K0S09_998 [Sphingobacteriaceae bacterium]|jgi:hypothetical protein|nr:hypothetical protein [Sphingobacteriaceae bacterium]
MLKQFKYLVFCLSAILLACGNNSKQENTAASVQFQLNADSSEIVLKGLDHDVLQAIQDDSLTQDQLESIFAVYKQASDEQLIGLEKPLPGRYKAMADQIIFTPDSAFLKGNLYRAEFRMPQFYDQKDVVTSRELPGKVRTKEAVFQF